MNIVDYIPLGEDNAVTRDKLCAMTGMRDRLLREAIAQARRNEAILNFGKGYFRPRRSEKRRVEEWRKQERARAKSIFWSMRGANKFVEEDNHEE